MNIGIQIEITLQIYFDRPMRVRSMLALTHRFESSINKINSPTIWCFYLWQTSNVIKNIFLNLIYHLLRSSDLRVQPSNDPSSDVMMVAMWCVFQTNRNNPRKIRKGAHRDQGITSFWSERRQKSERTKGEKIFINLTKFWVEEIIKNLDNKHVDRGFQWFHFVWWWKFLFEKQTSERRCKGPARGAQACFMMTQSSCREFPQNFVCDRARKSDFWWIKDLMNSTKQSSGFVARVESKSIENHSVDDVVWKVIHFLFQSWTQRS